MATIEEKLTQLEKDIRQLQIEYDSYFVGGRKRPPVETEWRVQTAIKRINEKQGRMKYALQFRFGNLTTRYTKYSEVWKQRAGRVEQGKTAFAYSQVARELDQQRLADKESEHRTRLESSSFSVGVGDPNKESEKVQKLFRAMVKSKQELGEKADIDFEQFHKFVQKKTRQLQKQMGVKQVEYIVSVEGGKVKLKARART